MHSAEVDALLEAAERGDAEAQHRLAVMYAAGHGVSRDDDEAQRWYHLAAEGGHADAQYEVGWYRRAAERGHPQAQTRVVYQSHGQPPDIGPVRSDAELLRRYVQMAEGGDAQSQYIFGAGFDLGLGVPADAAEAVRWYRVAAVQGVAGAQFSLGVMYANARGVRPDDSEAVRWYRRAADQGVAAAHFNLGLMYTDGRGVQADAVEAEQWYRLAAERGWGRTLKERPRSKLPTVVLAIVVLHLSGLALVSAMRRTRGRGGDSNAAGGR